jgi:putative MATE family efflux protein
MQNKKGPGAGKDLTKGPIFKQQWSLAWPMMLSFFFHMLYNLVDAFWVSRLSDEAIAAVSISQITLMVMMSLGFGIAVGSGVLMAMKIGAKDKPGAERILGQAFVLSAMLGVLFTTVALIFSRTFLTASGATGDILEPALEYYTIFAGGSTLFFIMMAIMFVFNSQGDTNTLTKMFAISTLVNIVIDPILIFGMLGLPAMGVSGAAIATLISLSVFVVLSIRTLKNPKRDIVFRFSNLSFEWPSVKKVLNIGFPAALTQIIFPLGLAIVTWILSQAFAEPGAIAFSVGMRIEFFAYLPAVGFGFGAMAMISQNIGAGNWERAREAFRNSIRYAAIGSAGLGILAALFGSGIITAFELDPGSAEYAQSYLYSGAQLWISRGAAR